MDKRLVLSTDGGARGNPGPAGIGGVLSDSTTGEPVDSFGKYLGERTNNQAEYEALLEGLTRAKALGAIQVDCKLDSQLVVEQLRGNYRVKDPDLAKLFVKVWNLVQTFSKVTFAHVPREQNKAADKLVNQAIDRGVLDRV
ncbi:MAG: ribonuclease HI family protein [Candidatus Kerfeldbacteria bacterium]|nr:ribonuclease HI family protein [Candidatus Kerfeldbacteria bacterium]